ncbi:DNA packaging Nu1 [Allopusillimonas soli]|uniref:Terminase small subunit n=1 Tax=Allopusillimonas soli TaxID=659016 RepID=A0A853FKI0_9BURK|nr:terminase small subunit [Allopusillimonas soli]NYT38881.1 terminase small subunit [Allopusillimonas soli]TEA70120.1 DNA packaging Nu1 [Allopusillimonas soli]
MIDLSKKTTQAKFAQLVGVTQPVISGLLMRGVLTSGDTAGNWLLAYCQNLRDVAAGREQTDSGLDLEAQKARLASAQADKVEMENEVRRGNLAEVAVLEWVLTSAGSLVGAALDAIPAKLKRRLASLTAADILIIETELAKVRKTISELSLEDIEAGEDDEDD